MNSWRKKVEDEQVRSRWWLSRVELEEGCGLSWSGQEAGVRDATIGQWLLSAPWQISQERWYYRNREIGGFEKMNRVRRWRNWKKTLSDDLLFIVGLGGGLVLANRHSSVRQAPARVGELGNHLEGALAHSFRSALTRDGARNHVPLE